MIVIIDFIYAFFVQINQMEIATPFYNYMGLSGYTMDGMLYLNTLYGLDIGYTVENLFVNYPKMGIENEKFVISHRYKPQRYKFIQTIHNQQKHCLSNFMHTSVRHHLKYVYMKELLIENGCHRSYVILIRNITSAEAVQNRFCLFECPVRVYHS